MKKKKVLHIITRFIRGGADENTLLTVNGLNKKKYEVHLAFGKGFDEAMINKVKSEGVKTKLLSLKHFNPFSAFISYFELYNFIKKEKFDIVHTHSTEAGIVGRWAAKSAGVPIIIHTIHGIAFTPYRNPLLSNLVTFLERLTARWTTHFISNADVITNEYLGKKIGRKEQYTTIYSGIDFKKFKFIKNKKSETPTVTMISRLAKGKGHDLLLETAKELSKERKIKFNIVGSGELKDEIKSKIKKMNLAKTVNLLGHREDVPYLIASSNMIVLPAFWEGTPRVISEAMFMKKPVIATNVGGIPEMIENNKTGLLIRPGDPYGLKKSIILLLDNPHLVASFGKNARKTSLRFSAENMVKNIEMLYEELLEE